MFGVIHGVLPVQIANVKLFLFWYAELGEQFQVLNFYKTCKYTNNELSDFGLIVEIKDLSQILFAVWVWPLSSTSAKDKSQKQILKAQRRPQKYDEIFKLILMLKSLIHKINALFVLHIFDNFHSWQNMSKIDNTLTKQSKPTRIEIHN